VSRAGWELNLKVVAKVVVEALERLDEQKVRWEPDRTAPIRVSAEQPRSRFTGLVIDAMLRSIRAEHIGIAFMKSRKCPDAERRQELVFVEHQPQDGAQLVLVNN